MIMKRFLLIAAVGLMVCSANAQQLSKKSPRMKAHRQTTVVKAPQQKLSKSDMVIKNTYSGKLSQDLFGPDVRLNKKAPGADVLRAGKNSVKALSRRAGAVQASYDAYGTDKDDGSVSWTMTSSTKDGALLFTDVIPSISEEGGIAVEYTLKDNTITIQPQLVAQNEYEGQKDYIFLIGASSEDGSITMTLNDDNSISTSDDILYGAFSAPTFDPTFETYTGYYEYVSQISYMLPGQTKAPTVFYEPDGVYLAVNFSPSWYAYTTASFVHLPVYAETSFLNYTQDNTDTWSWSMDKLKLNAAQTAYEVEKTLTSSSLDFSVTPEANDIYYQPVLKGAFNGAESESYQWSVRRDKTVGYVIGGGTTNDYEFSDGTLAQINKCDPANRVSKFEAMGTPTVNANKYNLSDLIFYQGKPAAPLYFEGISLWVGSFTKTDDFKLKCKIVKVTRDPSTLRITLGDVIAEADVDTDDIYLDDEDPSDVWAQLNWNKFYREDELGLSEDVDFLQIDEEFAIVFEGWNNGTFTAIPITEYTGDMVNTVSTTSSYLKQADDNSIYGFFKYYAHPYVSFKGAIYGYLHTEDNTNITLPAEGGQAVIHVTPMFYRTDEETNQPATAIWLAEDSEDIPDWLEVTFSNPVSTKDLSFDLGFAAEALPGGVTGRQANLVYEQWGAKLAVTVTQGEASGISVTVKKVENNTPAYNLAGQRVNSGYKGLVIKNGRKFMNK